MLARTKGEAIAMLDKFCIRGELIEDIEDMGTYYPSGVSSIASVIDLNDRLEVNMSDGSIFNIWLEDKITGGVNLSLGLITESKPFSDVVINEVKEVRLKNVHGFTLEGLDDGKSGIVFHFKDNKKSSFRTNNVAYVKTE